MVASLADRDFTLFRSNVMMMTIRMMMMSRALPSKVNVRAGAVGGERAHFFSDSK